MSETVNVYCDESCHLEHDDIPVMVLGSLWVRHELARQASRRIREIRIRHGLPPSSETKWVGVSPSKLPYYLDLIDYFFDAEYLAFRGLVIPDKTALNHVAYDQEHHEWYYKMYFVMLKQMLHQNQRYKIYLDIKDTKSADRVKKLHDVVCNSRHDFDHALVPKIQQIRSHESNLMQLADLLIGATGYANRGLTTSTAKLAVIDRIRKRSGLKITQTTLPSERKFNILVWRATEA